MDELVAEVLEVSPELVLAGEQPHVDLVDEAELAALLDACFGQLRLVGPDEVVLQRLVDHHQPGLYRERIVGGTVLTQEELEHINGHVGPDLDLANKVLAYNPPGEGLDDCMVELVQSHLCLSQADPSTTTRSGHVETAEEPSFWPVRASNTCSSTLVSASRFSVTWKVSTRGSLAAIITAPVSGS